MNLQAPAPGAIVMHNCHCTTNCLEKKQSTKTDITELPVQRNDHVYKIKESSGHSDLDLDYTIRRTPFFIISDYL